MAGSANWRDMNGTVIQGCFPNGIRQPPARPAVAQRAGVFPFRQQIPPVVQRLSAGTAMQLPETMAFATSRSIGRPLAPHVLQMMESLFRTSFADVRVHVEPHVSGIGATAFTQGVRIHFAPGRYQPETPSGQRLLAHELAHVVQQRTGRVPNPFGDGVAIVQSFQLEAEADRMAQHALNARAREQTLQMKRHPKFRGEKMSLGAFHAAVDNAMVQDWRQWRSDLADSPTRDAELRRSVSGVPRSTDAIPSVLYHITHIEALGSIQRTGLDPKRTNSKTGLNVRAGTSVYFRRDAFIEAVSLGRKARVGLSMQSEDAARAGGTVTLAIRPPWWFRYRYFRAAGEVLSNLDGKFVDYGSSATTFLSFGLILPQHLYLIDNAGKEHWLPSINPATFKSFGSSPVESHDEEEPDELFRVAESPSLVVARPVDRPLTLSVDFGRFSAYAAEQKHNEVKQDDDDW
jgi:hypothetical protein